MQTVRLKQDSLKRGSDTCRRQKADGKIPISGDYGFDKQQVELFANYLTIMNEAEYLMKNYGDRGGCYRGVIPGGYSLIWAI